MLPGSEIVTRVLRLMNWLFVALGSLCTASDGVDVIFHRGLGHVEKMRDYLVALPLHHQREHLHLPVGEPELGR